MTSSFPTLSELHELLPYLTPHEAAELQHHLDYLPLWTPQPGPQADAYDSQADILGYGGAAGGGKTDLGLGLALTRHRKSVIFRREATTLRDIVFRSQSLIGNRGNLNQQIGVWRGLPGDRILEFGGIKEERDVENWRGRPHDLKVFDEATEFLERQVRTLIAWNRTTIPGQRCRAVLCFNPPPNAEARWLLSFFGPWLDETHPKPARIGELRYYAMVDGREVERPDGEPFEHNGERITPLSRTFIQARVSDNLFLRGTQYEARLQSLPEPLRSQLWLGDFRAGIRDDAKQLIPTAWVKAAQRRWTPDRGDRMLSAVGVDVARGGAAKTVFAPRFGVYFGELRKYPGIETKDGPEVRRLLIVGLQEWGNPLALACIDAIGVGASAVDFLREVESLRLLPVNFSKRTDAQDKSGLLGFANMRAFAFWSLRELLDPANGYLPALPPDPELLADLTAIRWEVRAGLIVIEDKGAISKRLGRSPDCADAVAYSILVPSEDDE